MHFHFKTWYLPDKHNDSVHAYFAIVDFAAKSDVADVADDDIAGYSMVFVAHNWRLPYCSFGYLHTFCILC